MTWVRRSTVQTFEARRVAAPVIVPLPMRLDLSVASPAGLLPPHVAFASGHLRPADGLEQPWMDTVRVPQALSDAAPHRQTEYLAGRFCALQAIGQLGFKPGIVPQYRGPNLPPTWPRPVLGSIAHSSGLVCAAVTHSRLAESLAIDCERVAALDRAGNVAPMVAYPSELAIAREAGLDVSSGVTLVFSAKETTFKCLYPLVNRYFGFLDARLEHVDTERRIFIVRLLTTLSPTLRDGLRLHGRFSIDSSFVYTAMVRSRPSAA